MDIKRLIKECSKCGKIKLISEFAKHKLHRDGLNSNCKECQNKYNKIFYKENREKLLLQQKAYNRKHRDKILVRLKLYREKNKEKTLLFNRKTKMSTNGKIINGLNKRNWLGYCELCGEIKGKLAYHHWDDKNLNKGMWVCGKCHWLVTAYEEDRLIYLRKYIQLKKSLDKQEKKGEVGSLGESFNV